MSQKHDHKDKNTINHGKSFAIGIALNVTFVAVEIYYGLIANSSALLADAGHNASDVLSLIFAWTAAWLATKKPKGKYTYGFRKTTILVSVLNALMLFGAVIVIGMEAIDKISNPEPVAGTQVIIVAGIGVIINTFTALLFLKGQKEDLNIKGAFLHMGVDAAVSLGVVVSGFLILKTEFYWIDPMMSFIIILVILWGTWKLFIDSINLAIDAVPKNINIEKIKETILLIDGVISIHDLHVWAISTTENSLSVHLIASKSGSGIILEKVKKTMKKDFNIRHVTIQVEEIDNKLDCNTAAY